MPTCRRKFLHPHLLRPQGLSRPPLQHLPILPFPFQKTTTTNRLALTSQLRSPPPSFSAHYPAIPVQPCMTPSHQMTQRVPPVGSHPLLSCLLTCCDSQRSPSRRRLNTGTEAQRVHAGREP